MSLSLSRFLAAAAVVVSLVVAALFFAPNVSAQDVEAPAAAESADLLASLDADGRFTTLAAALRQTGLDETLAASGPYTLFAPTDDAFAALGDGTLEALSDEELAAILLTHVVDGTATSADAMTVSELTPLGGGTLSVLAGVSDDGALEDGGLTIGGATVIEADVVIGNATVHVVDAVLSAEADMDDADDMMEDADDMDDHDMSDTESADDGDAM